MYSILHGPTPLRTDSSRVDYAYDNISQLKTGKGYDSGGTPITGEQFGYNYDTGWNLNYRTNNGTTETFKVNSLNELTNAPGHSCTYDLNGNLITDGTAGFDYDDENQLVRITVTNSWKSEFTYDGKMRRRVRAEYTWSGAAWTLSSESRYIYDGNLVVQERDGVNAPTVSYTRGTDLSSSRHGAGGIGGMLGRYDHSTVSTAYYHADGNGNITSMIDAGQSVVASYKYDPYGFVLSQSGSLSTNNLYRWSSKEIHPNSGLVYYLYRYYEPNLQRWPNRDPIEEEGGINLYGFVSNDPIDESDSLGLWAGYPPTMPTPRPIPIPRPPIPRMPPIGPPQLRICIIVAGVSYCAGYEIGKHTGIHDSLGNVICPLFMSKGEQCRNDCNADWDAGDKTCRDLPPSLRRQCYSRLDRALIKCLRECNRKYGD